MGIKVTGIWIYPVKSCRGIQVQSADIDEFGLKYDRIYMIVEPIRKTPGRFKSMSQKRYPKMAKLHQSIRPSHGAGKGTVTVTDSDTGSSIELPLQPLTDMSRVLPTELPFIPEDTNMLDMGDSYTDFFTSFMGKSCRLVYRDANRVVHGNPLERWDMDWSGFLWPRQIVTACTDNAPIHFVTEESLSTLSTEMGITVSPDRFRPSFILKGIAEPWDEEDWKLIHVEGVGRISVTSRQPRCQIPNVNPEAGKIDRLCQPTSWLKRNHQSDPSPVWGQSAIFGMMATHHKPGKSVSGPYPKRRS
ncbi:hypothetical protein B0A52_07027 [Exophiala mesophila]|uniref:MOSC domain-containing protein n=1 Tax=Exophiala mesophila TaxID=212818 RepID=A0A438MXX8_EXOME|nr:hypothetical protein B0A52_07027 [Exophiala mesophila]